MPKSRFSRIETGENNPSAISAEAAEYDTIDAHRPALSRGSGLTDPGSQSRKSAEFASGRDRQTASIDSNVLTCAFGQACQFDWPGALPEIRKLSASMALLRL
jgi:hypothetical protein